MRCRQSMHFALRQPQRRALVDLQSGNLYQAAAPAMTPRHYCAPRATARRAPLGCSSEAGRHGRPGFFAGSATKRPKWVSEASSDGRPSQLSPSWGRQRGSEIRAPSPEKAAALQPSSSQRRLARCRVLASPYTKPRLQPVRVLVHATLRSFFVEVLRRDGRSCECR